MLALAPLLALRACSIGSPTLRDHPIVSSGAQPLYLDGADWTASWAPADPSTASTTAAAGADGTGAGMAATVPGDILTDLQRAGALLATGRALSFHTLHHCVSQRL